jgi:hypothetical protein
MLNNEEILILHRIEHLQQNERHSEAFTEVRKWLNELPERKKAIVDAECVEIQQKIDNHQAEIDKHNEHVKELRATLKVK